MAREHCIVSGNGLDEKLEKIQSLLLDVGSCVATPPSTASERKLERTSFNEDYVKQLEQWIDEIDKQLPPLKNFILPSGGLSSSSLHVARSVCRRAERSVVPLVRSGDVPDSVGRFLNRLSDFFFVAARFAAQKDGKEEVIYKKSQH
eukprot:TRINITY_DN1977_c0_g1_i1.p1 TRINITY_DN1977_c0_g1~~TRINITY_DN1977_c0_g1_i1.p1  ORF type:complete len:147 (-),score=31.24 TRINITY_DN1977_c0_g1_i1:294-734(-)